MKTQLHNIKKIYMLVFLLAISTLSFGQQWNQIGADIDGEAAGDK